MITFEVTKRTDPRLLERMQNHYSKPKGFVGRNICYAIYYSGQYYGHIVSGSATRFLPGRNEFLDMDISQLNNVINNIFFNVSPISGKYPIRNFTSRIVREWMKVTTSDWFDKYRDQVIGFETLVELPRTGELYRRAGFTEVGQTIGYTCKREPGTGTDSWTGKRVWDTENLRPKIVLVKKNV